MVRITKDHILEVRRRYVCSKCKAIVDAESKFEERYAVIVPKCPKKPCPGYMKPTAKDSSPGDWVKFQEIMCHDESPNPRIFTATLEGPLVNSCVPGESVELHGVVEVRSNGIHSHQANRPSIVLRCSRVNLLDQAELNQEISQISRAQEKWQNLVRTKGEAAARDLLIRSAFPSVMGLDYLKLALLLLMTGSTERIETNLGTTIRSQSHMLLVGDRGTAKTKLLKYVTRYTSPSVHMNAFGCTSAGLIATALKVNAHWQIQAGLLVLCDGGVCCIDDWNQLKTADQDSCNPAMEQQSLTIVKAGVSTRMATR